MLLSLLTLATLAHATSNSELLPTEVLIIEQSAKAPKKRGGGISSIGSDAYDVRTQTAWFYGTEPIITCYNRIEGFGASDKEVKGALDASIARWREYFASRKIVQGTIETGPNVNFKLTGKCKGEENLVVHFGSGPIFQNMSDLKAVQRLGYPVAYVNKTHLSRDLKWGKGYIRIVADGHYGDGFPNWRKPRALETVLTHELGHVVGFVHTPQTIMRAELVDQVFSDGAIKSIDIDGGRPLVTCSSCAQSFTLEGQPGPLLTKLGLKSSPRIVSDGQGFSLTDGQTTLPVRENSRTDIDSARNLWSNFDSPLNDSSRAFHLYGYIMADQNKIPLVLEYNSGSSGVALRALDAGEFKEVGRFRRE